MDKVMPIGAQGLLFEAPQQERVPGPIERAIIKGDDIEAIGQVLVKCSRILDECESGRDVKALSITVIDGIARRRELMDAEARASAGPSPLDNILQQRAALHG